MNASASQPTLAKELWTSGPSRHRSHANIDLQKVFDCMESCDPSAIDAKHLCSELRPRPESRSGSS